jgi:transcription antitermination factor NusG
MKRKDEHSEKLTSELELLVSFVRRYPLKWIIVYCDPQCERRAFRGLMEKGVMAWLPEQEIERRHPKSKRKFTVRKPVFPRYIFAGLDPLQCQSFAMVTDCDGVEGIVKADENEAPVLFPIDDLCPLMRRMLSGRKVSDGDLFKIGDRVKIVAGVFCGFKLTVEQYDERRGKIRGGVDIFGRQTPVELEVDEVKLSA